MKLIVGLGNPGEKEKHTRHNLGFLIIDRLLSDLGLTMNNNKFNGEFTTTTINGEKVVIARPLTFMNLSGQFVLEIMNYYKINIKDILVIVDDKDREIDKYKIISKGGSGGQNGVKDIISKLGTQNFMRLKGGVGIPRPNEDTANYVLSNFNTEQKIIVEKLLPTYSNLAQDFVILDFVELTNKYNGGI